MKLRSTRSKLSTKQGQPVLTGFETAVARTALSGAIRAISPVRQRIRLAIDRRAVEQELGQGASSRDVTAFLASLSPAAAQELISFTSSTEMQNIAFSLANESIFGRCGSRSNQFGKALKTQVRSLLALNTNLDVREIDAAAEVIFSAMSTAVNDGISDLLQGDKPFSRAAKASALKLQDSFISSAIRNTDVLANISSLSIYQTFEEQLNLQVRNLYGTMRLPHAGATRRVPYEKLYVEPTVEFVKQGDDTSSLAADYPGTQHPTVEYLANHITRIVLLGDPGGGKSTLSLKLTFDCASGTGLTGTSVPFLVVLREYAAELAKRTIPLIDYLDQICRTPFGVAPPPGALEYLLLNGRALVIFDGLDELLDTALRRQVADAVTGFAHRYPTTSILVTSRRVGYADAPLDPDLFKAVSLGEFRTNQVQQYVKQWFDLDEEEPAARREELRKSFMADSELVKDLRVNPLMLSLMCGIYASEHYIPRNRPDVYEKCALLLFDTWDKQRGIKPALSFDAHVQAAMRSLALWLYPQQLSRQGLPRAVLIEHMKEYLLKKRFDNEEDAENAAVEFVDFCKGRAWVLTDVGAELYGFTHRTFLEYFAASQIVRENTDPAKLFEYLVERLRTGGWEVVAQLALQILNKAVEDGADNFLEILLSYVEGDIELRLKWKLIAFATQSLAYIVPRPAVLRSMTARVVSFVCLNYDNPDVNGDAAVLLYLLFGAAPENLPLIAKYAFDQVADRLQEERFDKQAMSIALYAELYAIASDSRSEYETSNNNYYFWKQQRELQFPRFQKAAEAQRERYSWVAIYLLERGLGSIGEILERFGPSAFYGDLPEGSPYQRRVFPLVVRIVLALLEIDQRYLMPYSVGMGLSQAQIIEIKDALLRLNFPWFKATDAMTIGPEVLALSLDRAPHVRRAGRSIRTDVGTAINAQSDPALLSALLIFVATLADISDIVFQRGPMLVGAGDDTEESSLSMNLTRSLLVARMIILDRDAREFLERKIATASIPSTAMNVSAEQLSQAGVDEVSASLLAHWAADSRFRFISAHEHRRWRGQRRSR
jgi:NACHT domain